MKTRKPGKKKRGPMFGGGEQTASQRGQIGEPRCEIKWPVPGRITPLVTRTEWQCRKKATGVAGTLRCCIDCRKALDRQHEAVAS